MTNGKVVMHDNLILNEFQKQVCIGSLLGDMSGSVSKHGINYYLSCYHAKKQNEWLQLKWSWLQPYSRPIQQCKYLDKRDGKYREGARFHTLSAKCFTEIAKLFYVNGEKRIPSNIGLLLRHPISLYPYLRRWALG